MRMHLALAAACAAATWTTAGTAFAGDPPQSALEGAIAALQSAEAAPWPVQDAGGGGAPEVVATASRTLSENERIGTYGQPEWTAERRWARTRTYVIPEGQIEFEQWWRGTWDHGEHSSHLLQSEIGFGLPNRLQVDLYLNFEHEDGTTKYTTFQPEVRYAFADWGELPLNPTLYVEYKLEHRASDVLEAKLLFGDEITPKLHWGLNLSIEQELDDARTCELAVTQGISYTLADRRFSIGAEFEYDHVTERGARGEPEHEVYLGPSFQWRPTENTHLDVVPLFGMQDAHDYRVFIVFGIDLGGWGAKHPRAPTISKSR